MVTKKSMKKSTLSKPKNSNSKIMIFPSNYDEESQVILGDEYNHMLDPTASKSILITNESPTFSKNPSTAFIKNTLPKMSQSQSGRAIQRILSLQSVVDQEIVEQQENGKRRQKSLESLQSNHNDQMRYNRSKFLSYNNSAMSLDSIPSVSKLSPQARKEIERSLAVTKSQDKIAFRDFSLPPEHGRKRISAPKEDP